MSSNILSQIRQLMADFSESQKIVANYILTNYEASAFMTSTQLAKQCGTSESTVIRFAGRLGYERFADMQGELRKLVRGRLSQIDRLSLKNEAAADDSPLAQMINIMRTDMESIEKTYLNIDESELNKCVEAISRADGIFVIGTRSAYGLAHYFGYALSWIKPRVRLLDSPNSALFDKLANIKEGDVAIAISTPPYTADSIEMLQIAKNRGAITIAITDSLASPLAQYGTYCLPVHNEVMTFADNVAPILSLLTGLLALVSGSDPERSSKSLANLEAFWEDAGIYYQET